MSLKMLFTAFSLWLYNKVGVMTFEQGVTQDMSTLILKTDEGCGQKKQIKPILA